MEFLSFKGGCTGSSKSNNVKMAHCWKSHVVLCKNTIISRACTYILGDFDKITMLLLFHLALPPRKNSPASPNKPPKPTSTRSYQQDNSPAPRHDISQAPPVTPRRVPPLEPAHLKQESPEEFFGSKFKPIRKINESMYLFCFCYFTSQVNSYGHAGMASLLNHSFSWASLNKQLTSTSCTYFRL